MDSKDWTDWSAVQADLSLSWVHMPFCKYTFSYFPELYNDFYLFS